MSKKFSSTLLSCIVWGSGQFFICRQRAKGALLFAAQALFLCIEFGTGYWFNYFAGQIADFKLRLYGGYFTKGIWGLITLGTVPGVFGDHSTLLLINGIISALMLSIFIGLYVFNIKDAYKMAKLIDDKDITVSIAYGKNFTRKMFPYLVLAPVVFILLFIIFMPIVFSILTAFTNYDVDHLPPANLVNWVGLSNFIKVFNSPIWSKTFFGVLAWTIIWTFSVTFLTYFVGLIQALLISSKYVKYKSAFRAIYILPWAIPGMISLLVFRNLLNGQFGPINQILMNLGLIHERIPFLTNPTIAKITIILVNVWLGFPAFMIMLTGVMSNQDPTLFEAANIDGANKLKIFTRIKLPLLMQAMAPLIVMSLAGNFNAFSSIYFLTGGGPVDAAYQAAGDTDILISWIYKLTLTQQMYNMAAVMNILIFIFIGAVSVWNFKRTTSFKEM